MVKFLEHLVGFVLAGAVLLISVAFAVSLTSVVDIEFVVGALGSFAGVLGIAYTFDRLRVQRGADAMERVERLIKGASVTVRPPNWRPDHMDVLHSARTVTMVGLAMHRLGGLDAQHVRERLLQIVKDGGSVRIILTDPSAPQLQARWQDEGSALDTRRLAGQICDLLALRGKLSKSARARFKVLLFKSYPTFSLVLTDDRVYTFTYLFRQTGFDAAVVEIRDSQVSPLRTALKNAADQLEKYDATDASTREAELKQLLVA